MAHMVTALNGVIDTAFDAADDAAVADTVVSVAFTITLVYWFLLPLLCTCAGPCHASSIASTANAANLGRE